VKPQVRLFKNRGGWETSLRLERLLFFVIWWLGVAFAVIGVIAGAMETTLGLHATHWLLLSIATFLAGILIVLTRVVSRHLHGTVVSGKKEE
jgi:hypothetical protein